MFRKSLMAWGAAAALLWQGAHAAEVVVGQVAPTTGAEARQGLGYSEGLRLAFEQANRAAGGARNTFKLITLDDRGDVKETVANTRKLIDEHRPMVLAGYVGGNALKEVLSSGLLDKNGLSLVGFRSSLVHADHPRLFAIKAGMRDELNKVMTHLATVGWTRVGLFYEGAPGGGTGGDEVLAAAEEAATKAKVTLVERRQLSSRAGDALGKAAEAFVNASPQAIVVVASGALAGAFIERFHTDGGKAAIFAQSNADVEQLALRLGDEHLKGLVIAQVVPSPYKVTTALSKQFNDAVHAFKPSLSRSFTMMEGYVAGRVIIEAANRQDRNPTREGMQAALESINSVDLGGYVVGFSRSSHAGSNYVDLSIVSALGKIQQ